MSSTEKDRLPASKFAFPEERKEPLVDARHVRNAIARFDQVGGVSDAERDRAWKRIRAAARKYDVTVSVPRMAAARPREGSQAAGDKARTTPLKSPTVRARVYGNCLCTQTQTL